MSKPDQDVILVMSDKNLNNNLFKEADLRRHYWNAEWQISVLIKNLVVHLIKKHPRN